MARDLKDYLRLCVVRCRRLVFRSKSDFLIEQYQGLAALLEGKPTRGSGCRDARLTSAKPRNRYEACRRADVEPEFDDYIENDEQARSLIISANLQRRNLTKG